MRASSLGQYCAGKDVFPGERHQFGFFAALRLIGDNRKAGLRIGIHDKVGPFGITIQTSVETGPRSRFTTESLCKDPNRAMDGSVSGDPPSRDSV